VISSERQRVRTTVLLLTIAILTIIAYGDIRTRRIPNVLAGAIGILGITRMFLKRDPVAAIYTLVASAALLAIGFLLFWRGLLGGGDAKLVTTTARVIGHYHLFAFLFLMSLCGGALALAIIAREELRPQRLIPSHAVVAPSSTEAAGSIIGTARCTVPYGAAIAAAGVATLLFRTAIK
jgi:prepilin peptidase CpaA